MSVSPTTTSSGSRNARIKMMWTSRSWCLAVGCPVCGVYPDQFCRDVRSPRHSSHPERHLAAIESGAPVMEVER